MSSKNYFHNEWESILNTKSRNSDDFVFKATNLLLEIRMHGQRIKDIKTRNQLSKLAFEIADYISANGGKYPYTELAPFSKKENTQLKVFLSYSHYPDDNRWKTIILNHLNALGSLDIEACQDRKIMLGDNWHSIVAKAIETCDIAVLLLSANFLISEFIKRIELPLLLKQSIAGKLTIIPVLLEPCVWSEHEWLLQFKFWPNGNRALSGMTSYDVDAALTELALHIAGSQSASSEAISTAYRTINKQNLTPPTTPKVDISHLPNTDQILFGRSSELALLDDAWTNNLGINILLVVSPIGAGKSSLVRSWLDCLKQKSWHDATRVFGWSFYSQGTAEDRQASEEPFFAAALAFFGVIVAATASVWDKATALARAVSAQRTLLILDGLEPLQYPPGPMAGELKAPGVQALLKALVHNGQPGLCVITTREAVGELAGHVRNRDNPHGSVRQIDLGNLCPMDGARLLHRIGVQKAGQAGISDDDAELLKASEAVKGHALTLRILGLYLARAQHGDVRRWQDIDFAAADREFQTKPDRPYGHAFAAIKAYETWLASGNDRNRRQLAVLRLLGLFDRPATPDCLRALLQAPAIDGLTEALSGITEAEWNALLADLRTAGLVQTAKWQPVAVVGYGEELAQKRMETWAQRQAIPLGPPQAFTPPGPPLPADAETLDAHPLLREYFAKRLTESAPEVARAGHARLYEHLSASVPYWPEGEAGLAPLYQAVAHGCRAGRYEEARAEVYRDRINRRDEFYATRKLGLYGTELSAVAHFFREPWRTPVAAPALSDDARAWLLSEAAFDLRALGRLTEAVEPMQATVDMFVAQQDWKSAAIVASNLSELQQTLGALTAAIAAGEAAVRHADASGDAFRRMVMRTTLADARQQAGETAAALSGLAVAEALQMQRQPEYPRLYSLQGFQYCDALLQSAERTAWAAGTGAAVEQAQRLERLAELQAVEARAALTLDWAINHFRFGPLYIALDHLTQARVSLYRSRLLAASDSQAAAAALQAATMAAGQAVDGLRKAGDTMFLPRGLLTRACVHSLNADADAARADLDEAQRIAERGGMKLPLADVHLHRARLFDDRTALAAARQLIDEIGYERRRGELDDAQCRLDGRPVVLPEFASVLALARGENLPEPPAATDPTP